MTSSTWTGRDVKRLKLEMTKSSRSDIRKQAKETQTSAHWPQRGRQDQDASKCAVKVPMMANIASLPLLISAFRLFIFFSGSWLLSMRDWGFKFQAVFACTRRNPPIAERMAGPQSSCRRGGRRRHSLCQASDSLRVCSQISSLRTSLLDWGSESFRLQGWGFGVESRCSWGAMIQGSDWLSLLNGGSWSRARGRHEKTAARACRKSPLNLGESRPQLQRHP